MKDENENLRYLLRAFEETNACRAAALIHMLTADYRDEILQISREDLVVAWVEKYPRHMPIGGPKGIRNRITGALGKLAAAGILSRSNGNITVYDEVLLKMSANNLSIVEDENGIAVPPGRWQRRPECPPHLMDTQMKLEEVRDAAPDSQVPEAG